MSISLPKTSNKCFSFLRVTVEKSPTNGSLKYRIPVVFSPVVIPLNDVVYEMARERIALKSYR